MCKYQKLVDSSSFSLVGYDILQPTKLWVSPATRPTKSDPQFCRLKNIKEHVTDRPKEIFLHFPSLGFEVFDTGLKLLVTPVFSWTLELTVKTNTMIDKFLVSKVYFDVCQPPICSIRTTSSTSSTSEVLQYSIVRTAPLAFFFHHRRRSRNSRSRSPSTVPGSISYYLFLTTIPA